MTKKTYMAFVLPILVVFTLVVIVPFVIGIIYSFTNWNGISSEFNFVGIKNFMKAFGDAKFMSSLQLTIVYAIVNVVLVNLIGLGFALLVTSKIKTKLIARGAFFFPNLIGGLILGFTWQFIFSQIMPALNDLINAGGASSVFFNWLTNPTFAFIAICVVSAWSGSGYVMIIYIAALESISDTIIEAAMIDGANKINTFFRIKLPLIMSGVTMSLFITISNSLKIYDLNLSLTKGGPYESTEMATMNIYNEAFGYTNFGFAQAKSIIFFILIMVVTLVQLSITRRKEVEL